MIPISASATSAASPASRFRFPPRSPAQEGVEALAQRLPAGVRPRAIGAGAEGDLRAPERLEPALLHRLLAAGESVVPDDAPRMVDAERLLPCLLRGGI